MKATAYLQGEIMQLDTIEKKYNYRFPKLYRKLYADGMTNWMRDFEEPLPDNMNWAEDVYPTLIAHPPLLLHTGGNDFELFTPQQLFDFTYPESWDTQQHKLVPFARTAEGNFYAFYGNMEIDRENPVVLIWEDDETEIIAKNFEDFIFLKMLEAADDIDRGDLKADYESRDAIEPYREAILSDLESISPYLKREYVQLLEEIYHAQAVETLLSYGFTMPMPMKEIVSRMIDFPQRGETFFHEKH